MIDSRACHRTPVGARSGRNRLVSTGADLPGNRRTCGQPPPVTSHRSRRPDDRPHRASASFAGGGAQFTALCRRAWAAHCMRCVAWERSRPATSLSQTRASMPVVLRMARAGCSCSVSTGADLPGNRRTCGQRCPDDARATCHGPVDAAAGTGRSSTAPIATPAPSPASRRPSVNVEPPPAHPELRGHTTDPHRGGAARRFDRVVAERRQSDLGSFAIPDRRCGLHGFVTISTAQQLESVERSRIGGVGAVSTIPAPPSAPRGRTSTSTPRSRRSGRATSSASRSTSVIEPGDGDGDHAGGPRCRMETR